MKSFDYLTFDCYGTLVDWRTGIETALRRSLGDLPLSGESLLDAYVQEEARQEAGYKKYRDVLSDTASSLARRFGKESTPEDAARFAASVPDWPAFPDTPAALRKLGSMGYRRYILSNVDTDLLEATMAAQHLDVDGFVTAEQVRSYKPAYGHWSAFLMRTGTTKDRVLHVAQSIYHDIIPTSKLGISNAWVNRYAQALPPNVTPTFIADSLIHMTEILE